MLVSVDCQLLANSHLIKSNLMFQPHFLVFFSFLVWDSFITLKILYLLGLDYQLLP